jgi:hypothetical protein
MCNNFTDCFICPHPDCIKYHTAKTSAQAQKYAEKSRALFKDSRKEYDRKRHLEKKALKDALEKVKDV